MTPRQFLEEIVQPNVAEFHADDADMRRAYNAVASADALSAHLYVWCLANAAAEVVGIKDDTEYRARLAARHSDFRFLRDIAKAQKHVVLTRNAPPIAKASQINARPVGFGEGPHGHGRYGGPPQVVVEITAGEMRYLRQIIDSSYDFLASEMSRLGI